MPEPWSATLFPLNSSGPVTREGHTLWLAYWLEVVRGDRVHVIFEEALSIHPQGLRVAFERYYDGLQADGDEGNKTFLWYRPGRRAREVDLIRVDGKATLSFTNCWREGPKGPARFAAGATWLEPQPQPDGSILLLASDGTTPVGRPTLVVRLVHERAGKLQRAT